MDVFFATNRNRLPDQSGVADFGAIAAPDVRGIACGIATLQDLDPFDPEAGRIIEARVLDHGGFGPQLEQRILANPDSDILIFVHGAANTFSDSLQRAAYNANWISGLAGRAMTAIVFSWPARHYDIANIGGDLQDYRLDQSQAQASAPHFAEFLQALYRLRPKLAGRRLSLLAHSMGNYVMGFGVENWFAAQREAPKLFASVVLAAADEGSTTFAQAHGGRLSDLWLLSERITVYTSRADVLMLASHIANNDWRLGYNGPPNQADRNFFPPGEYEFLDCTTNIDFTPRTADQTHQYYRQSPTVRADVARVLKGLPSPAGSRDYDAGMNVHTLPSISVLGDPLVAFNDPSGPPSGGVA